MHCRDALRSRNRAGEISNTGESPGAVTHPRATGQRVPKISIETSKLVRRPAVAGRCYRRISALEPDEVLRRRAVAEGARKRTKTRCA